jgi:hypothetical protein
MWGRLGAHAEYSMALQPPQSQNAEGIGPRTATLHKRRYQYYSCNERDPAVAAYHPTGLTQKSAERRRFCRLTITRLSNA